MRLGRAGVGSSNTRPSATGGTPEPFEAGVDTWRLLFKTSREYGPTLFKLGPYQAQWMPSFSLLAVEGHPGEGLTPGRELLPAFASVLELVRDEGWRPKFVGVSRLDATCTVRMASGSAGVAFLQGVAAMDFPRLKPVVWGKPPETVGLTARNSRGRLVGRCYDSGLLRGTHGRGEAIRLEDQGRFKSAGRPTSQVFSSEFVRERFVRRFEPLARSTEGVRVQSLPVLTRSIAERVIEGQMTATEARRVASFVMLEAGGVARSVLPRRSYYRAKGELRRQGLVVADAFFEPVEVDVGEVFAAAVAEFETC